MRTLLLIAPLSALALLSACGEPTTITAGGPADPDKEKIAEAPKVKLPPAMLASKTYRCGRDNSLIYVNWFNDNMTANLKTKKDGPTTALAAPAAGEPYVGGGYTLKGKAADATVEFTKPGAKPDSCDA